LRGEEERFTYVHDFFMRRDVEKEKAEEIKAQDPVVAGENEEDNREEGEEEFLD